FFARFSLIVNTPRCGNHTATKPTDGGKCSYASNRSQTARDFFPHETPHGVPSGFFKSGIERSAAGGEVFLFDKGTGFTGAEFAVHAAVFPLNGKRPLIADAIQFANDFLEVHRAAARAAKVPA